MFTTVDWTRNVIKGKFIYSCYRITFDGAGLILPERPTDDIKDSVDELEKKVGINFSDLQAKFYYVNIYL